VIRKAQRDYPKLLRSTTDKFLTIAGIEVERDAKRLAPVDTGNLEGSITRRVEGNTAIVGTNVEYAEHVEYGTVRSEAQPYMRPAIDANRRPLIKLFAKMIKAMTRG
jgi:HK97 gp10 family phage protein